MKKRTYKFHSASTDIWFESSFANLKKITPVNKTVVLTDENVYKTHRPKFKGWDTVVLKPGEEHKVQSTVDAVIDQLIEMNVGRDATLVGVGGGVVTDITGYVASIYKRGIKFGFVPTTVLAMVDASIGGKNGIDIGPYKNMVGTIRQPAFILHDHSFLHTLPGEEWINGFAEIIKHASIADAPMFHALEKYSLAFYRRDKVKLAALLTRNAELKVRIVQKDELEKELRMTLNFGHTLGHALENLFELSHGRAISIGMTFASQLSEKLIGFRDAGRVISLLDKYGLPTHAQYNIRKVFAVLGKDKKRQQEGMHFVLLERIGKAVISKIPIPALQKNLQALG